MVLTIYAEKQKFWLENKMVSAIPSGMFCKLWVIGWGGGGGINCLYSFH